MLGVGNGGRGGGFLKVTAAMCKVRGSLILLKSGSEIRTRTYNRGGSEGEGGVCLTTPMQCL